MHVQGASSREVLVLCQPLASLQVSFTEHLGSHILYWLAGPVRAWKESSASSIRIHQGTSNQLGGLHVENQLQQRVNFAYLGAEDWT
jgi:hypothetical protein